VESDSERKTPNRSKRTQNGRRNPKHERVAARRRRTWKRTLTRNTTVDRYRLFLLLILTVRVELSDDGLYDSGALGDVSSAYWHAVTGGITHRASPPYSHVSGHAGTAAGRRACGRPTALATGITRTVRDGGRTDGRRAEICDPSRRGRRFRGGDGIK